MSKELTPSTQELQVYQVMAKTAVQSKFFDKLGGEAGILSIMLMARELGIPPMQAIQGGMNIIQGKVEISPRMMNTMIRRAGHSLQIIQSDENICTVRGVRSDTKEDYTTTFNLEDAKRAGLVRSGGPWEKFASDMLFARCISRLARRLFADVISTAYVDGEIDREEPNQASGDSSRVVHDYDPLGGSHQTLVIGTPQNAIEEFIALEAAYCIDRDIQLLIAPVDREYRKRALEALKIDSFEKLPLSQLERVKANILRKVEELRKTEVDVVQPEIE